MVWAALLWEEFQNNLLVLLIFKNPFLGIRYKALWKLKLSFCGFLPKVSYDNRFLGHVFDWAVAKINNIREVDHGPLANSNDGYYKLFTLSNNIKIEFVVDFGFRGETDDERNCHSRGDFGTR